MDNMHQGRLVSVAFSLAETPISYLVQRVQIHQPNLEVAHVRTSFRLFKTTLFEHFTDSQVTIMAPPSASERKMLNAFC